MQNSQIPNQINVDLRNAEQQACKCGCKNFVPVFHVYKLSALMSPTGREIPVQVPVLICNDCGEILK